MPGTSRGRAGSVGQDSDLVSGRMNRSDKIGILSHGYLDGGEEGNEGRKTRQKLQNEANFPVTQRPPGKELKLLIEARVRWENEANFQGMAWAARPAGGGG